MPGRVLELGSLGFVNPYSDTHAAFVFHLACVCFLRGVLTCFLDCHRGIFLVNARRLYSVYLITSTTAATASA